MKQIKSFKFKSRVIYIENGIVDLSCGINIPESAIGFDVELGKDYEFELHGENLHEYYLTLAHCRVKNSEEWEEV